MASNNNELIFTHDYIKTDNCNDNEYGLIVYSSNRAKALHVGINAHIKSQHPDKDKVSCVALMEILHGHINAGMNYKDSANLDTLIDTMDSESFSVINESDYYDSVDGYDDDEGYLSALNSTVE